MRNAEDSQAQDGRLPAESPPVLRLEGVTKAFGKNRVLSGLDLSVRAGENLAILGRSGSGKSVLLKIVTGLLPADGGEISLWGRPVTRLGEDDWAPLRRRMGMVFQSGALFDSMTVFENVAFPLLERKHLTEEEIRHVVGERLRWVGLPGIEDFSPSQLSGGMRRRVALARTLAADPEFILYDEPTTGLDPLTGRKISQLMRDLDTKLRSTVILVTHDIECAKTVARRWAFLSEGRVLADGSPAELLRSDEPEVHEFFRPETSARDLPPGGPKT